MQRHEVTSLYHCTPCSNLELIFQLGGLLSRSEQLRLGVRAAKYHGWGKKWASLADYVCLGFSPPRHIREESDNHVVLRVKADVVWLDGVVFCPCNSAKDWFSPEEISARDDLDSFEDLFQNEHGSRLKRQDAEILVPRTLGLQWIDAVLFLQQGTLRKARWQCLRGAPWRFVRNPSLWKKFLLGTR